ncbi:putative disease resistance protein At4g10780 [Neltuma alba]|uniref:putative disease resistance protein At4g10780 n=1 Tax=Neltuma alba TaxID=207710 RepID=UPI0010A471CF|nr:putative disease resistance protein At4g10780 [Prosopis alba]
MVGSAMARVKSVEAWEYSKNNLTTSDRETEVFSILKFSYDQLPDKTLQKCSLYCALYPEDYEIQVSRLIDKWIGEGFLYNERMRSGHDMCSHGGSIIETLKPSCLSEKVKDNIFLERSVKMHDVICDMALWIACDEGRNKLKVAVQEDGWAMSQANVKDYGMVETISIMKGVEPWIQSIAWTNLTTLLLKFDTPDTIYGLGNIQYARQLKVLELFATKRVPIPTEIGGLNHLEYLSLVNFKLTNAPDIWRELENLKNLKVFNLSADHIRVTPLGLIPNLQQVKVCRLISICNSAK